MDHFIPEIRVKHQQNKHSEMEQNTGVLRCVSKSWASFNFRVSWKCGTHGMCSHGPTLKNMTIIIPHSYNSACLALSSSRHLLAGSERNIKPMIWSRSRCVAFAFKYVRCVFIMWGFRPHNGGTQYTKAFFFHHHVHLIQFNLIQFNSHLFV